MYVCMYVCMCVCLYVCVCVCICVCICSRLDEKHFCGFDCEFIICFAEILEEFQKWKRENKPEKNSTQNKKARIETS